MHTPTATSPRFVPETRDGRLLLSLTLPADCPTLDNVILPEPGALPLPDAVIRLDVARLAQAIESIRSMICSVMVLSAGCCCATGQRLTTGCAPSPCADCWTISC